MTEPERVRAVEEHVLEQLPIEGIRLGADGTLEMGDLVEHGKQPRGADHERYRHGERPDQHDPEDATRGREPRQRLGSQHETDEGGGVDAALVEHERGQEPEADPTTCVDLCATPEQDRERSELKRHECRVPSPRVVRV